MDFTTAQFEHDIAFVSQMCPVFSLSLITVFFVPSHVRAFPPSSLHCYPADCRFEVFRPIAGRCRANNRLLDADPQVMHPQPLGFSPPIPVNMLKELFVSSPEPCK